MEQPRCRICGRFMAKRDRLSNNPSDKFLRICFECECLKKGCSSRYENKHYHGYISGVNKKGKA